MPAGGVSPKIRLGLQTPATNHSRHNVPSLRNPIPDPDAPIKLRAARELSAPPRSGATAVVPTAQSEAEVRPDQGSERDQGSENDPAGGENPQSLVAASMAAVVVIAALGWAMERRHRRGGFASARAFDQPLGEMPTLQDPVLPALSRRPSDRRLGTPAKKKLIRFLFWLRALAGAAAILCAIAVIVFWAIESADVGASETGLNLPLLAGLLAGWVAYWGCGRLANTIHRSAFHRDHPRFAD